MLIKEMITDDKPRERLIKYGKNNLTYEDLLAIILRTGTKSLSVKDIATNILLKIDNISELRDLSLNELTNIKGLKEVKAITLIAAIELGRRVYANNILKPKIQLNKPILVYNAFANLLVNSSQEQFLAVYLNTQKKLINYKIIFTGTVDHSLVHPRDIFKEAYRLSASAIIIIHNHPSGDITPSKEDILLTKNLREISKIMGVLIIDHIIIGDNKYFSFMENNMLMDVKEN